MSHQGRRQRARAHPARLRTEHDGALASYGREFEQAWPAGIWPGGATRFAARFARVNLCDHRAIPEIGDASGRSEHGEAQAMTHERLRRFNTRDSYPEQRLDNDLCQVVKARGTLAFVRGQVGQDLSSSASVAIGDAAGQAEQAMANVAGLLAEAGARLEDICKITIYLTDPRYREPVYRTVGRWLKAVFPVSTGLVVSGLARPEWLVEIEVIAVIPDQRQGEPRR